MQLTSFFFLLQPYSLVCMPLMQKAIDRFGFHSAWLYALYVIWTFLPLMMLSTACFAYVPFFCFLVLGATAGFNPFKGFVDSRFCEPEQIGRFQSVQWLMGYFLAIFVNPLYGMLFNAESTSYVERALPNLMAMFWMAAQVSVIIFGMYVIDGGRDGFRILLSMMDSATRKSKRVWEAVPKDEHGHLTERQWDEVGMGKSLGKTFEEIGGTVYSAEHWGGVCANLAPSMKAIKKMESGLDEILESVRRLKGPEAVDGPEAVAEAKPDELKKED